MTLLNCDFNELWLYWTVTLRNCYFYGTVTFAELLLYGAVTLRNCYFTELFLYGTVSLRNCYFTELLLYWTVTLLYYCFTEFLAFLKVRNSEVSHPNFLWLFFKSSVTNAMFVNSDRHKAAGFQSPCAQNPQQIRAFQRSHLFSTFWSSGSMFTFPGVFIVFKYYDVLFHILFLKIRQESSRKFRYRSRKVGKIWWLKMMWFQRYLRGFQHSSVGNNWLTPEFM